MNSTWGYPSSQMPSHDYELKRVYILKEMKQCTNTWCEEMTKYEAAYGKIGEYWTINKVLCEGCIKEIEPFDMIEKDLFQGEI